MDPTSMGRQAEDGDASALEGALEEDPTAGDLDEDGHSAATTAPDGL